MRPAVVRLIVVGVVLSGCSASGRAHPTAVGGRIAAPTPTTPARVLREPGAVTLPATPSGGIGFGSHGSVVLAYQRRLKQLHFDPGPLDGAYGNDTQYAVTAVDKLFGLARDGAITAAVRQVLEHFAYRPALPNAEAARVEVDLDRQVLTVYQDWQPILITTASTGSGEYFCGGTDGCQYAITPAGHFRFQFEHHGWDNGKLGEMWNPYYFDGGIAVHGLPSVPPYPASHGCVRIPMDIANYFPTLVRDGESVYVVGTAMKPGNNYVGPAPTTSTTTTTTTVGHATITAPRATETVPHRPTTKRRVTTTTNPA